MVFFKNCLSGHSDDPAPTVEVGSIERFIAELSVETPPKKKRLGRIGAILRSAHKWVQKNSVVMAPVVLIIAAVAGAAMGVIEPVIVAAVLAVAVAGAVGAAVAGSVMPDDERFNIVFFYTLLGELFLLTLLSLIGPPFFFYFWVPFVVVAGSYLVQGIRLSEPGRQKSVKSQPPASPDDLRGRLRVVLDNRIDQQKDKLLGEGNEISTVRVQLERARDEACELIEFWHSELEQADGDVEGLRMYLEDAIEHRDIFTRAIGSLDERKEAILALYRRWKTRVSGVDREMGRLLAAQRQARISKKAKELVPRSEQVTIKAASECLSDVLTGTEQLRDALIMLNQVALKSAAPHGKLEDFESWAKQIAASEDGVTREILRLEKAIDSPDVSSSVA